MKSNPSSPSFRMNLCLIAASAIVAGYRAQAPAGCDPQNLAPDDPIEKAINEMQNRMNAALAELPPIEQVGLAAEIGYAIRACRRMNVEMQSVFEMVRTKATEVEAMAERKKAELVQAAKAEVVKDAAFLKASGYLSQVDHDAAVLAARGDEKQLVQAEFEKATAVTRQVAERRKKLVTDKKMSPVAAEALSDETLTGDDWETKVGKIAARLEKLGTLKVLAEDGATIKRVVTFPITAEGDASFTESFDIWSKAAKSAPGGPGAPLNTPPGDGVKKPVFF